MKKTSNLLLGLMATVATSGQAIAKDAEKVTNDTKSPLKNSPDSQKQSRLQKIKQEKLEHIPLMAKVEKRPRIGVDQELTPSKNSKIVQQPNKSEASRLSSNGRGHSLEGISSSNKPGISLTLDLQKSKANNSDRTATREAGKRIVAAENNLQNAILLKKNATNHKLATPTKDISRKQQSANVSPGGVEPNSLKTTSKIAQFIPTQSRKQPALTKNANLQSADAISKNSKKSAQAHAQSANTVEKLGTQAITSKRLPNQAVNLAKLKFSPAPKSQNVAKSLLTKKTTTLTTLTNTTKLKRPSRNNGSVAVSRSNKSFLATVPAHQDAIKRQLALLDLNERDQTEGDTVSVRSLNDFEEVKQQLIKVVRNESPSTETANNGFVVQQGWDEKLIEMIRAKQKEAQSNKIKNVQTSSNNYPTINNSITVQTGWDDRLVQQIREQRAKSVNNNQSSTAQSVNKLNVNTPTINYSANLGTPTKPANTWNLSTTPDDSWLDLRANAAIVVDQQTGKVLYEKNSHIQQPIASITKLMTALVTLDAGLPMDEMIEITEADRDYRKGTSSRLSIGSRLSRSELLLLALMASENRAASALGNSYPGGHDAFVEAMNRKARELGMTNTFFEEGTGLSTNNVSTPADLIKLVNAASKNRWIRYYSTIPEYSVFAGGRYLDYRSTNRLIHQGNWEIGVQKTGYISEAGRCLVLEAKVNNRPTIMVFLDSVGGKGQRFQDARRVRDWLELGNATAQRTNYDTLDYGVDEDAY